MSSKASRTLYVGNLPGDIREREVEDIFYKQSWTLNILEKRRGSGMRTGYVHERQHGGVLELGRVRVAWLGRYGPIVEIDLKIPPRPPGYAFVEFEDSRDAEDAIRGRDGYDFDGHRLRVELAHGGRGQSSSIDRYSSYSSGGSRGGISRRSDYRVWVSGLPPSASWQDLKDHMRRAGDVCFSQVYHDGRGTTGVVDYTNYEDMRYAVHKLDDSEFRNAFSRGYIRVREYESRRSYSRSPTHSRSYSRSRSPSYSRSYSRSRSQSYSPKRKSNRALSRSRSRSVSSRSPSVSEPRARSESRSRSPLPSPRHKHVSKSSKRRSPSVSSRSLSRSRSPSRSRSLSR